MNGISLLLLLSTVGATTSVETGANGQPVYTIRIESLLINELRAGQAVPIVVAPKDRRIRYFRIAIAAEPNLRNNSSARASDINSRAGDLYDYEPTQLDNGEIEYAVQISPERLESLAKGKAIEGEIAPNIDEVHRFFIFVGIGQLPSQQQAAQQQAVHLAANGDPLTTRGAEIRAPSTGQPRSSTASTTKSFQPVTQSATQRNLPANDPYSQFNTRSTDTRMHWRNQPDQSTISPPPFINSSQQPTSTTNSFPRSSPLPTNDRNQYVTQPNYNNYQQPNYQDQNSGYGQQNPTGYPPQGYAANPPLQYPQQQQQPAATIAARNDVPAAANPAAQPANGWSASANQTAVPPTVQPATVAATAAISKAEAEKDRPWTPLILTTLALFASLGTNAYLGWLAWSFFWRFRDAVTESARTRAQISSSRQAA